MGIASCLNGSQVVLTGGFLVSHRWNARQRLTSAALFSYSAADVYHHYIMAPSVVSHPSRH